VQPSSLFLNRQRRTWIWRAEGRQCAARPPPRETLKPWFDRASTAPEVLVAFPPKGDSCAPRPGRASCWGYGLVRVRPLAEELHFDPLERCGASQGALPGMVNPVTVLECLVAQASARSGKRARVWTGKSGRSRMEHWKVGPVEDGALAKSDGTASPPRLALTLGEAANSRCHCSPAFVPFGAETFRRPRAHTPRLPTPASPPGFRHGLRRLREPHPGARGFESS
jgi:hypothetical protein